MGLVDGLAVGLIVGLAEGAPVGDLDCVGAPVGREVVITGARVGKVGVGTGAIGARVGVTVGERVGSGSPSPSWKGVAR